MKTDLPEATKLQPDLQYQVPTFLIKVVFVLFKWTYSTKQ